MRDLNNHEAKHNFQRSNDDTVNLRTDDDQFIPFLCPLSPHRQAVLSSVSGHVRCCLKYTNTTVIPQPIPPLSSEMDRSFFEYERVHW